MLEVAEQPEGPTGKERILVSEVCVSLCMQHDCVARVSQSRHA